MIQNLSHRGYFTLRKRYFCYEIQKSLKDNLALNAALTEMVGVTGVDPITIRQSLIPSSLRPLSNQGEVE